MKKNNVFVCGIFAVTLIIALAFTACSESSDDPSNNSSDSVAVTDVTLNQSSLSIMVGNTAPLTATVLPSNASNKNVSWSSSNNSVATVDNGTVTAVAAGSATITVTTADGGKTATCTVTVNGGSSSSDEISGNNIVSGAEVIYDSHITNITEAKGVTDFSYCKWWDNENNEKFGQLSNILDGSPSATVNNNKVTIILGTPKSDNLINLVVEGITVNPNDAKFFQMDYIHTSDKKYGLYCKNDDNYVAELVYADKNVTLNGTQTREANGITYKHTYNVSLKKGWNYMYVLNTETDNEFTVTSSTTQPSGFKWTVYETGYN